MGTAFVIVVVLFHRDPNPLVARVRHRRSFARIPAEVRDTVTRLEE